MHVTAFWEREPLFGVAGGLGLDPLDIAFSIGIDCYISKIIVRGL